MPDHSIEFSAAARVCGSVTADAERAVAVRKPQAAGLAIAGHRETFEESRLRRIAIHVRQQRDRQIPGPGTRELRREPTRRAAERSRWRLCGVAPLRDKVVLNAIHGQSVEVAFARQPVQVLDVQRGKLRRQLEDDPARRQFEIQRSRGIERPPFPGLRRGDDRGGSAGRG